MIYHIEQTTSTNDEARRDVYDHLDAIWSEHQTAGRGQRGHTWHSVEGENVTFSVVLKPTFLPVVEQFLLSEIVAISLVDTMKDYGIDCRIKWTNDLYAGDS
ncbi:MAG: biotin--[acetyl-CoA-carboxylase] ligase, partial [Alistipes sp.]|nr:biotin--[acetyl-CoA-carboxylase] ligase [Alistipes sp.]